MILLTDYKKQTINGGVAFVPIAASAIKLLHGVLTTSWIVLEGINLVADHIKVNPKQKEAHGSSNLIFENYLINSKITISS